MSASKTICVFCSASSNLDPSFQALAEETGKRIAKAGFDLVFGGGRAGLMGIVANAALENGAKVTGVIPGFLKDREIAHDGLTNLEICKDMHERQKRMADLADAFIVLPGGMGTMAEFFEIITWKQLGHHDKPIALINHDGYWDGLETQMSDAARLGFLYRRDEDLYQVFEKLDTIGDFFRLI